MGLPFEENFRVECQKRAKFELQRVFQDELGCFWVVYADEEILVVDSPLRVIIRSFALRLHNSEPEILIIENRHNIIAVDKSRVSRDIHNTALRFLVLRIRISLIRDFEIDQDFRGIRLFLLKTGNFEFCLSPFFACHKRLSEILCAFLKFFYH